MIIEHKQSLKVAQPAPVYIVSSGPYLLVVWLQALNHTRNAKVVVPFGTVQGSKIQYREMT